MAPISASSFDILLPTIFLSQLEYTSIQAGQLATWLVYLPKFPFRFLKRFNHEPGFHSNHFRPTRGVFLMRYRMGNAFVRLLLHNMGYIHQSTLLFFFGVYCSNNQKAVWLNPYWFWTSCCVFSNRDWINLKDHSSCGHIKRKKTKNCWLNLRCIELALSHRTFVKPGYILFKGFSGKSATKVAGSIPHF